MASGGGIRVEPSRELAGARRACQARSAEEKADLYIRSAWAEREGPTRGRGGESSVDIHEVSLQVLPPETSPFLHREFLDLEVVEDAGDPRASPAASRAHHCFLISANMVSRVGSRPGYWCRGTLISGALRSAVDLAAAMFARPPACVINS